METIVEESNFANALKTKRICRFCLTQTGVLGNIYVRDARMKASAPLPLQIMAIASIEVFSHDGMPALVCDDCRLHFEYCYRFKQMCKRADTLLRQYPLVGKWPQPLSKPAIPTSEYTNKSKIVSQEIITPTQIVYEDQTSKTNSNVTASKTNSNVKSSSSTASTSSSSTPNIINSYYTNNTTKITLPVNKITPVVSVVSKKNKIKEPQHVTGNTTDTSAPKKLLNASPADAPEPPVPKRLKIEKVEEMKCTAATTNFFNKVENNEELSMNDVQLLIQSVDDDEELLTFSAEDSNSTTNNSAPAGKPKILNKFTKRILNKEANTTYEPRLSKPQIVRDEDGNVEIVTEILDPNEPEEPEPDPLKVAPPVETNVFPCPYCVRSFPLKQLLDIHIVNHTRERKHHCSECEKSFFSKYDLQKHIVIHTGERPYQCTVCEKSFTRAALLHRHEKTHTDIPKYICVYCEKPFLCKDELEKHTERHLKHRPYECQICKKSFAFKQGLERHETAHSTDKPFSCQYCEMSFITAAKLARHLTAHAGKRAYPCKYCNKSFLLSHHLTRHLRSHKDIVSSYDCSECSYKCNAIEEFLKHSADHAAITGNCQLCKQSLEDQPAIDEHFKEHAKEVFACEFCDLIYLTAEQLQMHTNADHFDELKAYELEPGANDKKAKAKRVNAKAESNASDDIDLNEMGIYLDDILIDDILLFNDRDQSQQPKPKTQQSNTREQRVVVHESIKIEPATVEEQLQHKREQQQQIRVQQNKKQQQQQQQIPAKTRKVLTADNQIVASPVTNNTKLPTKTVTSPPLRRKVPAVASNSSAASATTTTKGRSSFTQTKIKIENETISSSRTAQTAASDGNANQVLKTLPKGVTIRRNTPVARTPISASSSAAQDSKTSPSVSEPKKMTPTANTTTNKDSSATSPLQRRTLRIVKKTPNATTTPPAQPAIRKPQRVTVGKEKPNEVTKNKRFK